MLHQLVHKCTESSAFSSANLRVSCWHVSSQQLKPIETPPKSMKTNTNPSADGQACLMVSLYSQQLTSPVDCHIKLHGMAAEQSNYKAQQQLVMSKNRNQENFIFFYGNTVPKTNQREDEWTQRWQSAHHALAARCNRQHTETRSCRCEH